MGKGNAAVSMAMRLRPVYVLHNQLRYMFSYGYKANTSDDKAMTSDVTVVGQ